MKLSQSKVTQEYLAKARLEGNTLVFVLVSASSLNTYKHFRCSLIDIHMLSCSEQTSALNKLPPTT